MVLIITAVLFVVLGALIKFGKMYFLIAGYNTMSKEEQEKYDIEGIAHVFWNAMAGMGLLIILGYFFLNQSFHHHFLSYPVRLPWAGFLERGWEIYTPNPPPPPLWNDLAQH